MKNSISKRPLCPGYARDPHRRDIAGFYQTNRRGGGRSHFCKECHRAYCRDYFKQKYYPENRDRLIEANARRNREKRSKD